jgi:hypothetical protein
MQFLIKESTTNHIETLGIKIIKSWTPRLHGVFCVIASSYFNILKGWSKKNQKGSSYKSICFTFLYYRSPRNRCYYISTSMFLFFNSLLLPNRKIRNILLTRFKCFVACIPYTFKIVSCFKNRNRENGHGQEYG